MSTTASADEASGPAGEPPEEPARPSRRPSWPVRSVQRLLPGLTLPGAWGAVVFTCLSLTPSLLPRSGLTQGLVSGISAAIGYGLGVLAAYVWRAFADREARPARPRSLRVFAVAAPLALLVFVVFGLLWQRELRQLMGSAREPLWLGLLAPVVALAAFAGLLAVGRGVRRSYRWLSALLGRRIGPRAARTVGWLAVAAVVFFVVTGLLLDGFVALADRAFSVRDRSTPEGVEQPVSALRSGGSGSLVEWDGLGQQGRIFVAGGPSTADIAAFTGGAALEPVRAYAGIATDEDVELRAARVVADLERAGGFERSHLLVATTTGTGWLDPGAVDSFEYITGGDSAIVSMQYSYLPSWISFVVDQDRAREAGRQLFDAVYERWLARPPDGRPELYVFGESLGSFGGEAAFSGEFDLRNRTDGALFVGPPHFNTLHRQFTDERDPGSREVEPVFRDGRIVRYSNEIETGAGPAGAPWDGTRVLYLQHPSDPIVWWNLSLLYSRPDWLREEPGRDVLDAMVWIPFVTFWQVTADMPFAVGVPDGHGHHYTRESVDAWAAILGPPGWSEEKAERLRGLMHD